jgi:hypothetical protein
MFDSFEGEINQTLRRFGLPEYQDLIGRYIICRSDEFKKFLVTKVTSISHINDLGYLQLNVAEADHCGDTLVGLVLEEDRRSLMCVRFFQNNDWTSELRPCTFALSEK